MPVPRSGKSGPKSSRSETGSEITSSATPGRATRAGTRSPSGFTLASLHASGRLSDRQFASRPRQLGVPSSEPGQSPPGRSPPSRSPPSRNPPSQHLPRKTRGQSARRGGPKIFRFSNSGPTAEILSTSPSGKGTGPWHDGQARRQGKQPDSPRYESELFSGNWTWHGRSCETRTREAVSP